MHERDSAQVLHDYRITRRFVAAVVFVGVAVSIAVNQLDAHTWIGKGIAGWPPFGLLLTLELLTRIPTGERGRVAVLLAHGRRSG